MSLWHRRFNASEIEFVAAAESFGDQREPPLVLGNFVRLNSGGPIMMVVDPDGQTLIAAWRDNIGKTHEHSFPVPCVHRIPIACANT